MPGIKPFTEQVDSEQTKAMNWIAFFQKSVQERKEIESLSDF